MNDRDGPELVFRQKGVLSKEYSKAFAKGKVLYEFILCVSV